MMPEIELYCCGVKVKVFKHVIDEFNDFSLSIISFHNTMPLFNGANVEPYVLTDLNNFCIASQQTQLIINRMKAAA